MTIGDPANIHQAFADAINAGDLEDLVALFDTDAVVVERTGTRTSGADNIRKHLQQLLALNPKMTIQSTHAFAHHDVALLCSRWTATTTTPDGQPVTLDFRGSEVARRDENGDWHLYIDNPWGIELTG